MLVAFLLSEAIFKGPMGHLADRVGPKRLMVLGPSLSIGTSLLSLLVPHGGGWFEVLCFVLLRAIDGLGAAMLWPAAFSAMGDAVEDKERQQAMSLLNLCYMLGIALALPIGGIANDLAGVKWAGLILASILFMAVTLGTWKLVSGVHHSQQPGAEPHGEFKIGEFIQSCKQIPTYLLIAVITFAGIGFPMAIFKLFPIQQFKMSETQIGFLIFPGAIAMGIASVPMSKFGEKNGRGQSGAFGDGAMFARLGIDSCGCVCTLPKESLAIGYWRASRRNRLPACDPRLDGERQRYRPQETRREPGRGDDRARSRRYHWSPHRLLDVRQAAARWTGGFFRALLPICRVLRLRHRWMAA